MSRRNPELRQQFETLHHKFKLDDSSKALYSSNTGHVEEEHKKLRPRSAIDFGRNRKHSVQPAKITQNEEEEDLELEQENQNTQPRPATAGLSKSNNILDQKKDRVVPFSLTIFNNNTKSFIKIRTISDEDAEKMIYTPDSEMMRILFQKNDLKIYVGPGGLKGNNISDEKLITKSEYLEIEDTIDIELHESKNALLPTSFKRLRKQKLNEKIIEHFDRLDAIKQNMKRMDSLLKGYEVKNRSNPVDALNIEDISDLVMKDLVTREGVMTQTKQIVENISEENRKLTKEKHHLLQELTNWFNTHGIDIDTLQVNSVENDDPSLLREFEETPFQSSLKESLTMMKSKKDKLESIFANYKTMKDETREEEKRKYLSEFERKIQHLESNLVGQVDNLEDAESKIQLLLKKILYLTEELDEEKELCEEKSRLSMEYRSKYLQYKGLMVKIINRLQEPNIRDFVDIKYILTGENSETIEDTMENEIYTDDDLENIDLTTFLDNNYTEKTKTIKNLDQSIDSLDKTEVEAPELGIPRKSIADQEENRTDLIATYADNAMWYTQGEDVETPEEYIIEYTSLPLTQLTPLEVKLRVQIDYLNEQIRQMEMERYQIVDFDANTFSKDHGTFEERNKLLTQEIQNLETKIMQFQDQISERDTTIDNQNKFLQKVASESEDKTRNLIEEFVEDNKRNTALAGLTVSKMKSNPREENKITKTSDIESNEVNDENQEEEEEEDKQEDVITMEPEIPQNTNPEIPEVVSNIIASHASLEVPSNNPDSLNSSLNDNLTEEEQDELRRRKRNENYIKKQETEKIDSQTTPKHGDKSFKKELKKKKSSAKVLLSTNEFEEHRVKDRNKAILDETAPDDLNILFDKNSDEYTSTDDIIKALESMPDIGRLKNIAKLLVVDRESILEQLYGTHQRARKFFEFLSQIFSNKSNQTLYTESEFISDWIVFNRKLDTDMNVHSISKGKKEGERRTTKKMTLREELKYQTTYAIDNEKEEYRRRNNPVALSKSVLGILVKMYLHLKVFMRRKINSSDKTGGISPTKAHTRPQTAVQRSKSVVVKRRRKKVDLTSAAITRMENHRLQMKELWEEKKKQIIMEQRNRFASYSLVPRRNAMANSDVPKSNEDESTNKPILSSEESVGSFDGPPTLDNDSIETKRKLSSISPTRSSPKSPRPKSAAPTTNKKSRRRLSIDLHLADDEEWHPEKSW